MFLYVIWKERYARAYTAYKKQIEPILNAVPNLEVIEIHSGKRLVGWGLKFKQIKQRSII